VKVFVSCTTDEDLRGQNILLCLIKFVTSFAQKSVLFQLLSSVTKASMTQWRKQLEWNEDRQGIGHSADHRVPLKLESVLVLIPVQQ